MFLHMSVFPCPLQCQCSPATSSASSGDQPPLVWGDSWGSGRAEPHGALAVPALAVYWPQNAL